MISYFTRESRASLKSFSRFYSITAKTMSKLNLGRSYKCEIKIWKTSRRGSRRLWSLHVVVFQGTAKKCTKNYNARAQQFAARSSHRHSIIFCSGYCHSWSVNKVWGIALAWDEPKPDESGGWTPKTRIPRGVGGRIARSILNGGLE